MGDTSFVWVNSTPSQAVACPDIPFLSLSAPPKSDIYASPGPPPLFVYTAPVVCRRVKKSCFSLARVTVSAKWTLQFDQGGLVVTIPTLNNANPDASSGNVAESHPAWVKVGIEVNDGAPCVSIVGKSRNGWCDWSLVPLEKSSEAVSATLELTRFKNALMVWLSKEGSRVLIRKVPWVFLDDEALSDDMLVGIYAAQPDPDDKSGGKGLEVSFSNFRLEEVDGAS